MTNRESHRNQASNTPPQSLAGRVWKAALGLILIAAGSFFTWYLYSSWEKARQFDDWVERPAVIVSSEVKEWQYNRFSRVQFVPDVRYRYTFEGKDYAGDRIRRIPSRYAERKKAENWVERFPAGAVTKAYVDPANPETALLKRETKAALYSIWFPLLFVIGGAGILISALFRR